MKKVLLIVGGIILVIIVLAAIGGGGSKSTGSQGNSASTTSENKPQPSPMAITASELADDFDSNQVAAEAKWKGKLVEFEAKVSNITDNGISFYNIATKDTSLTQISCQIKDKNQLLKLKNGETAKVRGTVGGQTIGVIDVNNCEVVS